MKYLRKFRRWSRWFLGFLYLFVIIWLVAVIRKEYVSINASSVSNNNSGGIAFGISLIIDEPQTLISDLNEKDSWSKSFLVQSQSPTVHVFLDYISIYPNSDEEVYCFNSFYLSKNINIPIQLISEAEDGNGMGSLVINGDRPNEYEYKLKESSCLSRNGKYFYPHLPLGIIESETSANLIFDTITGYRALDFFPFEKQKIVLNLRSEYQNKNADDFTINPNLEITISQRGWIGAIQYDKEGTTLNLSRPSFYKGILLVFIFAMPFLILLLNNILDVDDGFFEVAFGLLLGLWGTHEILIPGYIETSIPIDAIIYILYALVIGEIVIVFIDELITNIAKHNVRITHIERSDLENEHVVIENLGIFAVDMTNWILFDQALNKFKFPVFVLSGKIRFSKKTSTSATIWTKLEPTGEAAKLRATTSIGEENKMFGTIFKTLLT
ncbi:MAG: hypothetical protein U0V02_20305 [Anaerolineales bacterium]